MATVHPTLWIQVSLNYEENIEIRVYHFFFSFHLIKHMSKDYKLD